MAELKTKATTASVTDFLNKVEPEEKRKDSFELLRIFEKITGEKPVMWGTSIVGFGKYHYKSERSTQEGDWPLTGFSPRKQNLTLYVMHGNTNSPLLEKLGKHKTSAGCLYINKLSDVDQSVLEEIVKNSFEHMKKFKSVDEYIESAPKEVQGKLKEIRSIIKGVAPGAEEKLSYGMPYYGYKGRLAYFAYAKDHVGLYVPPPVIQDFEKELEGYSTATATVRFPNDKKLPIELIKKLVKARVNINEAKTR